MRTRTHALGKQNLIGKKVTELRREQGWSQKDLMAKLQIQGVDINYSSLSKLEGQTRTVTDRELVALSRIFKITPNELLDY